MEFQKEQIEQIKKQLIEQINSTFPEDKKAEALKQIEIMNDEQLIEFLKQNNLIKSGDSQNLKQCIFCSIVFGEVPSTKISENEKAIAILEINPVSKGHALIITKEHVSKKEDLPQEAFELAKEISEKLKILNPKQISIEESNVMGHEILNVVPVYENETLRSPRNQKTPQELEEIKKELEEIPEEKSPKVEEKKPQEEINEKNTWLPKRIP